MQINVYGKIFRLKVGNRSPLLGAAWKSCLPEKLSVGWKGVTANIFTLPMQLRLQQFRWHIYRKFEVLGLISITFALYKNEMLFYSSFP